MSSAFEKTISMPAWFIGSMEKLNEIIRTGLFVLTACLLGCQQKDLSTENLIQAVRAGKTEQVASILQAQPQLVDTKIPHEKIPGCRAIHWAIFDERIEVVKLLIAKGADVNAVNDSGDTPLHWVAWGGHEELVKLLVSNGAALDAKNKHGQTPLESALANNKTSAAVLLRKLGAKE